MKTIGIDIETKSGADLSKCGVYKYVEDPDWEIQLFGYSIDSGPVQQVDFTKGEKIPQKIIAALQDKSIRKWAHNVGFERINLSRHIGLPSGQYISPEGWYCTMVASAYNGLPRALADVGKALKLPDQKLEEGKDLVRLFSVPRTPTKKNPSRWNKPEDYPSEWALYCKYNIRDVEVEDKLREVLEMPPDSVWREMWENERINDRGVLIDQELANAAIELDSIVFDGLIEEMKALTGLENPNSPLQLKEWLSRQGINTDTVSKDAVADLLKQDISSDVRRVLELRLQTGKTSAKKYQAMVTAVCDDGRLHGMFRFYGASRTGRFSGSIVQLQNLKRNSMPDLDTARTLVKQRNYPILASLYDDIPDVLGQLVRTAIVPPEGKLLAVADYSAIEARVLAWLSGEKWVIDAFRNNEDLYCATASRMYHCKVEKDGENSELRARGKQAVLACIAEGSLVLTDQGLVPIEQVTTEMKLWDGKEWVTHDGVIYRGERDVITYDGLTATPDHLVYIEGQSGPVYFGLAAASGSHLIQTGDGRRTIRLGEDNQSGKEMGQELAPSLCIDTVPRVREHTVDTTKQFDEGLIEGVPKLHTNKDDSEMAGSPPDSSKAEVRESEGSALQALRCERYKVRLSECNGSRALFNSGVWPPRPENGDRPDRQQRELCSGESQVCNKEREYRQSEKYGSFSLRPEVLALCGKCSGSEAVRWTHAGSDNSRCRNCCIRETQELARNKRTARVYDIRNAGRHHRFTVSGRLVHNCGYSGGIGAIKAFAGDEISDSDAQDIVDSWREANPHTVQFWYALNNAAKDAVIQRVTTSVRVGQNQRIRFRKEGKWLLVDLPSGRHLSYYRPKIGLNKFGTETVNFIDPKTGVRIDIYGGSFAENCTQALARDLLCNAMHLLEEKGFCVVGHIHDECIVETPATTAENDLQIIEQLMSTNPSWAKGLPLAAAGYVCTSYRKD